MDKVNLDYLIGLVSTHKKPINQALIIKRYIPIEKKIAAIDKLFDKVVEIENKRIMDVDPIKKYVNFTLMAISLYTNLDLEGTYEEYDKLQSNGLIDKIFKEVKNDYLDLKEFMDMRFEHRIAQLYSSPFIEVGE